MARLRFTGTLVFEEGELKVDLGDHYDKPPQQQKPIAAELYAIHHLLSVKEMMGSNRSGNGLQMARKC